MTTKPTYEDLKQRVRELQKAVADQGKPEEDYRSMIEYTNDVIATTTFSLKPTYTYISPSVKKIMGYEPEELIGKSVFKIIHPSDKKKLLPLLKKYLKAKVKMALNKKDFNFSETIEYRAKDKLGNWHYLQSTGNVIGNKLLFISRDITENKEVKERLETSEEVFRTLTENTPIGIYYNDFSGKFIYGNKKAEEIVGYKSEELIGKNFLKLKLLQFKDIGKAAHILALNKLGKATGPEEFTLNRKDGSKVVVEINTEIITIGGKTVVLGMAQDITSRKQVEEALKESRDAYRATFETTGTAMLIAEEDTTISMINKEFEKLCGYSKEEVEGKKGWIEFLVKADLERMKGYHNLRMTDPNAAPSHYEFQFIDKQGNIKDCLIALSLIPGTKKTVGSLIDITERKKAEEEKITLEAQLIQAQKMEAIGTLAGGMAHNFNNLLMSIQGNVSLMLLDAPPEHPHYERLTTIEKSVQSGSKLTSQLLGYARGGSYEVTPISINHIIHEISSTFAMTRKDITLHHDLANALAGVKADRGQIEQVVLNIYVNAAEAMPTGGYLYITTENIAHTQITKKPYTIKPGTYILLTIKDTGIGMDKHTQEKVFDPFFTTKGLAKGTGLGLASVYGIIKAHGGYIDVASQKGEGTTFSIYLPASEEIIREEPRPTKSIETGNETILLVDDEEIILDVGEALLTSLGYRVLTAQGGDEAITILRSSLPSSPPDLVILDLIMPGMGGGETYDRMKEIHPPVKVLLSSGYSIDGQAKEILKRGCNGFLQKPFTLGEVSKAIREVVDS